MKLLKICKQYSFILIRRNYIFIFFRLIICQQNMGNMHNNMQQNMQNQMMNMQEMMKQMNQMNDQMGDMMQHQNQMQTCSK